MNKMDVSNGIRRAWDEVDGLGIGESFSSAFPLEPDDEFKTLATSDVTKYTELFLAGLRLSSYNFVLIDYSYFQFGWSGVDEVRYAYYPNPFVGAHGNIEKFRRLRGALGSGVLTFDEYHAALTEGEPEARVPLLRYENAPSQRKEFRHPCSHLHIGHDGENRWPVRRVLTPLAFCLIVLKQYYPTEWAEFGDDDLVPYKNSLEGRLLAERQNCRILGNDMFSADEDRTFHWA